MLGLHEIHEQAELRKETAINLAGNYRKLVTGSQQSEQLDPKTAVAKLLVHQFCQRSAFILLLTAASCFLSAAGMTWRSTRS
jgi:hypothetical protein